MRNTTVRSMTLSVFAAFCMSLCVPTARADTQALIGWAFNDEQAGFSNRTIGWTFSLSEPVAVTYLGLYDASKNGITPDHRISIWRIADNEKVADALLSANAETGKSWHWVALNTPVTLQSGSYVIGSYTSGYSEAAVYRTYGTSMATGITYGQSRYIDGDSMPTSTWSGYTVGLFGPNFQFRDPDPVPEPALIQLPLLLGLGGVAVWRRSRIHKHRS